VPVSHLKEYDNEPMATQSDVSSLTSSCEDEAHSWELIQSALGPEILKIMRRPEIEEVYQNETGPLFIKTKTNKERLPGSRLSSKQIKSVIRILADHLDLECNGDNPLISGALPVTGWRFTAELPTVKRRPIPTFNIRKRAETIFTLDDYEREEKLTARHRQFIENALIQKKNLLIAGSCGSGKTSFANALLDFLGQTDERILIIQDTV
jgi:type IV secretion system protein TrbB